MTKKQDNAMERAFELLEPVLAAPDNYPSSLVIISAGSPLLSKIFSKEPTRIVDYLRKHGTVSSISQLAALLGRDPAAVSRDVKILERYELLVSTQTGRYKSLMATNRPVLVA